MARRVLLVGHAASRSGAPRVMLHLVGGLSPGWYPEILLRTGGPLEYEFAQQAPLSNLEHPRAHGATPGARIRRFLLDRPLLQPSRLRRWVDSWRRHGGFDIIHNNTATNGSLLPQLRRIGCPIVTHLHETHVSILRSTRPKDWKTTLQSTDQFIVVSEVVREDLITLHGVKSERIEVIPNFLPALPEVTDDSRLPGMPAGVPVVGACGYIDSLKGADLFAEVAARVADRMGGAVYFVWAGTPVDRGLTRRLKDEPAVRLLGEVADGADLAKRCDLVIVTSREESFSMTALEAAAAGRPVIGFQGARGLSEVLGMNPECLVPGHDVEAMAERVLSMLLDEAKCNRTGRSLRERVKQEFLSGRRVPEIEAIWESVIHGR